MFSCYRLVNILIIGILFPVIVLTQDMEYLDDLLRRVKYDKRVRPSRAGEPVKVKTQLSLQTLGPIDEKTSEFHVEYYLRHWWYDYRLDDNSTSLKVVNTAIHPGDLFWIPRLTVINSHKVDTFVSGVRTKFTSNGKVYTSERFKAICSCPMDLKYYPLDQQTCNLIFESYALTGEELSLSWHAYSAYSTRTKHLLVDGYTVQELSAYKTVHYWSIGDSKIEVGCVEENPQSKQSQSKRVCHCLSVCDGLKTLTNERKILSGVSQTYDKLIFQFHVKRTKMYYIFRAYLPSILMMIFDMASYWIPITSLPARVTLIVTTFLASTFILQSVSEQTIKVDYITPLQLFLFVNVTFISISIVQFAVVLMMSAKEEQEADHTSVDDHYTVINGGKCNSNYEKSTQERNQENDEKNEHNNVVINQIRPQKRRRKSHVIDAIFRIMIPILYVLFATVYFIYYFYLI